MYIILYAYLYRFQSALSLLNISNVIPGNGWACTVKVLKDYPFSVDTLVDDIEYTLKIKVPVRFIDEGIVVYNEAPEDWGVSWRQRMRWTRGGFQLLFGDYSSYAFSKSFILLFPLASLFYTFSFLQSLLHPVSFLINLPASLLINMLFYGLFLDKEDWKQVKLYDLVSFFFFSLSQYVIIIISLFTYREKTWVRTLHKGGDINEVG
jgi:cellulose synthase/poly-beta-1,6-N-acetylglucosamine synthase-like glycosyltransferase